MKQHKLITIFLIFTLLLVMLNSWTYYKRQSWKRVYYTASIGVARNHPVDLYAKLITINGEEYSQPSLSSEDDFGYWGNSYASSSDIEYMTLPDSLFVHWVSLRERKIYKGAFKLPHKIIDSIFKNNTENKKDYTDYYGKYKEYFNFSIGIAPKGKITVWIQGKNNFQKEIARFQAQEFNNYLGNATGQESIDILVKEFHSSNHKIDSIIKNKIPPELDKWDNFSEKFTYYLIHKNLPKGITSIEIDYFNEDRDEYNITDANKFLIRSGAPKWIRSNEFEKKKQLRISYTDTIITIFKTQQKLLKPNDTLVFLLEGSKDKKSTSFFVTTKNELDSLKINN